ncbi:MAG: biotin--[acetyl-CoA-carboxylase] ligase [Candidatus Rokubacteria bacterium]|nr:biotin--[acetyl-CoA-carboxylase] ligase [Candidatus Rokubacteria bacterium]
MSTHPALVSQAEERLAIQQIRRTLATERVGFQTYLFGEVGSTNTVLRRLADTGAPDGTVVLAETQTMGRGRLGKPWFSPPGLNLYASVLFRPASPPSAVPVFSFISSLALTDAIWAEGLPAGIKWPNDVLVDRRKVAGTLAAYASAGDVVEYVILGIGVNLNVDHPTLASALGPAAAAATSLREAAGRRIDRNAFTAAFLNLLEKWDNEYRTHGSDAVLEAWRERDALAHHIVEIRGPADTYRGRAIDVNREGRLVVEDARGARREIVTGEIVIIE